MNLRFKQLLAELSAAQLDLFSYTGEARDVAFDLTTADSFLAGIVDRLRGANTVPAEFRAEMLRPWLQGASWYGPDGSQHDLVLMPESLFEYALLLERIRSTCVRDLREQAD